MRGPIVEVRGLRKDYGSVRALDDLSLEISAGGIIGFLGPNGAGKTTFLEILEGLRTPTAGQVSVLGFDPARDGHALRERIGVQLQSTSLPQDLTSLETLKLFAAFFRNPLDPAEVLAQAGLEEKAKSRTRTLSGGQLRRLAIATALINDPELVFLDEPTSGLDPVARRRLFDTIEGLQAAGRTVLLTTHSLEEAEQLCDRVIILRRGAIVADSTPLELASQARGASTVLLTVDGPFDDALLRAAGAERRPQEGDHMRFSTHDPTALIIALGQALDTSGARILDVSMTRPGLEALYLDLMGEDVEGKS